jgi:hypothetical protein
MNKTKGNSKFLVIGIIRTKELSSFLNLHKLFCSQSTADYVLPFISRSPAHFLLYAYMNRPHPAHNLKYVHMCENKCIYSYEVK